MSEQEREAQLVMLIGHMADVLAELRATVYRFHASEKNVRLRTKLEWIKENVYHLCDSHAALVANVQRISKA